MEARHQGSGHGATPAVPTLSAFDATKRYGDKGTSSMIDFGQPNSVLRNPDPNLGDAAFAQCDGTVFVMNARKENPTALAGHWLMHLPTTSAAKKR